jgi:DNA topoisomerase-1
MAKYLVIIEAPGKIKKIQSFLGSEFEVVATKGHIKDLPEKELGIDIKNDFTPTYEVYSDKKSLAESITSKAKKSDIVYLFTDLDREGEQIANLVSTLLPKGTVYKRIKSNSITKEAVLKAMDNAGDIDEDLVNAAETRRLIDRLVGYKSSYVVKQSTGGISAGRTQSAGLRILAELEKLIKDFVPVIYWPIEAELLTEKKEKIIAIIKSPKPLDISTKEEADKIIAIFKKGPIKVSSYDVKNVSVKPYGPFTTSSLQQAASSILGFSPDKTMSVAQSLYQAGTITYHRTDSTNIIPEMISNIRSYISDNFDKKYLPNKANIYASKVKNAQEAHEAIRPTDISIKECSGSGYDEAKLYKLIWQRTIAYQMSNAEYERRSVEFSCDKYVLSANGSKELFDGFRKVWDYSSSEDKFLPDLKVGDIVYGLEFKTEERQTSPPSRYSEASFIKELENRGIGRPATFASIPKTLKDRTYIDIKNKSILVTDLGMKVNEFLVTSKFCFVDLDFTQQMEEKLDEISNGKLAKLSVLTEFWTRLKSDLDNAKIVKNQASITNFDCPKCKAKLVKKHSKFGPFLGCSNYGNKEHPCDYVAKIDKEGNPVEKTEEKKEVEYSNFKCENCDEKLIVRQGKKGKYLGCKNFYKEKKCCGFYDATTGEKFVFKKKK